MKLNSTSLILVNVLRYLLIAFVLTISLYPILWVLLNSFKQNWDSRTRGSLTGTLRSLQSLISVGIS